MAIFPEVFVCFAWACSSALAAETSPAADCTAVSEDTSGTRTLLQVAESSDARAAMGMKGRPAHARGRSSTRKHLKRKTQTNKELDQDDPAKLANEVPAQIHSEDTEAIDSDTDDDASSDEYRNGNGVSDAKPPPLSEEGYSAVVKFRRKLERFVAHYSGRNGTRQFAVLRAELKKKATELSGWLVRRVTSLASPHGLLHTDRSQGQQSHEGRQSQQSQQSQERQQVSEWLQCVERVLMAADSKLRNAPFCVCLMGFVLVLFVFDDLARRR